MGNSHEILSPSVVGILRNEMKTIKLGFWSIPGPRSCYSNLEKLYQTKQKHWCLSLDFHNKGAQWQIIFCLQRRSLKRLRFNPWIRKIPFGRGNDNPLQYSFLENPMDKGDCPWGRRVTPEWTHLARMNTITKYHELGELNNRNVFLTVLEAGKSKIKVPQGLSLMRALSLGYKHLLSHCVRTWPLHVHTHTEREISLSLSPLIRPTNAI